MTEKYLLKVKRRKSKIVELYSLKVENSWVLDATLNAWKSSGYQILSCERKQTF